jgi:mannose-6-phosphate isomerase-like protein (cupin superfamily)
MIASQNTIERFTWGDVCDGWRLLDQKDLSVIEESVSAGAGETWHLHDRARQFFYVLDGTASFELAGEPPFAMGAGEGIAVDAGRPHRISNPDGPAEVRFLVISAPATRGDRRDWSPAGDVD